MMMDEEVSCIRYFVAKCANVSSLKKCVESNIWACKERTESSDQPKDILSQALEGGTVILIFSVNNCHGWHGYCEIVEKPGSYVPPDKETAEQPNLLNQGEVIKWEHFQVSWKCAFIKEFGEQCLPFSLTEFNLCDNTPVNKSRNWQELPFEIGKKMCLLLDTFYKDLEQKRQTKLDEKKAQMPVPFLKSEQLDEKRVQEYWESIVAKVETELGQVHLACPFGSQRYNLNGPDSDIDVFIVYQAHTKDVLSFKPPKQTIKNSDVETCDYTILELHRYCELLSSGDPRCVETLYLHPSTVIHKSPEWTQLTALAQTTLTRQCLEKYLRDAQGSNGVKQLKRWRNDNPDQNDMPTRICKLCYIIVRLLQNARDVVNNGPIKVFRPDDSQERRILKSLRHGKLTANQAWEIIQRLEQEIEDRREKMSAEETSGEIQTWLLKQRFTEFNNHPPT